MAQKNYNEMEQLSVETKTKIKTETWIYWRYKIDGTRDFFYSYVQEIIDVGNGDFILELAKDKWGTNYPTRVLQSEIQWYQTQNKQQP